MDELLVKQKLPGIYITRVQLSGGRLELTGPCGKPLMDVPDVRIPHSKLNMDEREYIFGELSKFILENRETIDEIIKIHSNRIELMDVDGYSISHSTGYDSNMSKSILKSVTIRNNKRHVTDEYISIEIDNKGKIMFQSNNYPINKLEDFNFQLGEMVTLSKKAWKNAKEMDAQRTRLAELKTCKY